MRLSFDQQRQAKAKQRLNRLLEEILIQRELSQGDVARRIYYGRTVGEFDSEKFEQLITEWNIARKVARNEKDDKAIRQYAEKYKINWEDAEPDVNAIRQNLSKYKNTKKLNSNGNYHYQFSEDAAIEICDAINKYSAESAIHAGTDYRWEWLAGLDDIPTYYEEYHGGYLKDLQKDDDRIRRTWGAAPLSLLEYAADQLGFKLVSDIDSSKLAFGQISYYHLRSSDGVAFEISRSEMAELENNLRTYASFLISNEIQKHKKAPSDN